MDCHGCPNIHRDARQNLIDYLFQPLGFSFHTLKDLQKLRFILFGHGAWIIYNNAEIMGLAAVIEPFFNARPSEDIIHHISDGPYGSELHVNFVGIENRGSFLLKGVIGIVPEDIQLGRQSVKFSVPQHA